MMTSPSGVRQRGRMAGRPGSRGVERLTATRFRALHDRLCGSVPWDPADRRGALNYLTPERVRAGAAEVRLGRTVSMAAPVEDWAAADNPEPCRHRMSATGAGARPGLSFALDRMAMNIHGNADTHIDALCHVIFDGTLYNGVPAGTVTEAGASELSIGIAGDGIAGRGVLLDIPRLRGTRWLEPGDHVTLDDLLAAERAQRIQAREGDLLFVRVGHRSRRRALGPWDAASARAGLHPGALELIAERKVSVLGSDGNNDTAASATEGVEFPVHVLAIHALGLHLLDYLELDELARACAQAGRWAFFTVIAPLRLPTGTGSPVNPIAIL
jgi:kynurenine formamidase